VRLALGELAAQRRTVLPVAVSVGDICLMLAEPDEESRSGVKSTGAGGNREPEGQGTAMKPRIKARWTAVCAVTAG
jgi:hypothetical protein